MALDAQSDPAGAETFGVDDTVWMVADVDLTSTGVIAVNLSGAAAATAPTVAVTGTSLPTNGTIRCYWSPKATTLADFPPDDTAPIWAVSKTVCAAADSGCTASGATLKEHPALPWTPVIPGNPPNYAYTVSCWLDADGDGKQSQGDYTGSAAKNDFNFSIPLTKVTQ